LPAAIGGSDRGGRHGYAHAAHAGFAALFDRVFAFQMAHDMALSGSLAMERVKYLQGMAEKMLSKAHGRDSENGDISYYLERS
jgi:hypothetical protein